MFMVIFAYVSVPLYFVEVKRLDLFHWSAPFQVCLLKGRRVMLLLQDIQNSFASLTYGSEKWFLTLRGEYKLQDFGKKHFRVLRNEELSDL